MERDKLQIQYNRLINEGGVKSRTFWKIRKQILNSNKQLEYDLITEDGTKVEEKEQAQEYIAKYFENLYCARPPKPEYIDRSNEIENQVKSWAILTNQEPPTPINMQEVDNAIKCLKRGKSCGQDDIPNEAFIEADRNTRKILLETLNQILTQKIVPEQWQVGEITRIYKGKGIKGKCSNERGITVSSNMGKLLERIINNRAKMEINISDAQAGGKQKRATTDHLLILKDIIRQQKRRRKPLYITFLDVTKAYDKAWLDGLLYNMYNRGVQGATWNMIRKLNQNLKAEVKTKHGNSRSITIKDSIRQGGVLSVMMYSAMMDEIAKKVTEMNKGIKIGNQDSRVGCLLWMDDVALISDTREEAQELLDITNEIANTYHLEFGAEKSKVMIFNTKDPGHLNLGTLTIEETATYKYLGEIINTNSSMEHQIKELKRKTEGALQTILSIAGDPRLKEIQMGTIWKLVETCITPIAAYGGETWKITKKNMTDINRILDNILKRILMTPVTTPREVIYMETGLIDLEHTAIRNRINMLQRITEHNNDLIDTSLQRKEPDQWITETNKLLMEMGLEEGNSTHRTIKEKVSQRFKQKIEESGNEKSKVTFLKQHTDGWEPGKRMYYMNKLTRIETSTIFKARTRMLDIKDNFRGKYQNEQCRGCNAEKETQDHVLNTCKTLHTEENSKVTTANIFKTNPEELKKSARKIGTVMAKLAKGGEQQCSPTEAQPGDPGLPDQID